MDFVRNAHSNGIGFLLKDLEITTDYAGNLDKYKIIDHLTRPGKNWDLGVLDPEEHL